MTIEEQKAYNAENYPASVLTWLNEATDRAYDDFESMSFTRVEVIGKDGRVYVENNSKFRMSIQDKGRTLKLFKVTE